MKSPARAVRAQLLARRKVMERQLRRCNEALRRSETALNASEARFQALVDALQAGVLLLGPTGRILAANAEACTILGRREEDLIGRPADNAGFVVVGEDGREMPYEAQAIGGALMTGSPRRNVLMGIRRHESGDIRWVLASAEPIAERGGGSPKLMATLVDITERRMAAESLQAPEAAMLDLQVGIVVFDAEGRVVRHNPAALSMLGVGSNDMAGWSSDGPFPSVVGEDQRPLHREAIPLARTLSTGEPVRSAVIGVEIPDRNERRWLLVNTEPQFDEDGRLVQVLSTFSDISERKQFEEQLQHQAMHDPLTDLPNRMLLVDRLEQATRMAERAKGPVSLLLLDLNRFKEINDTFGHHYGDLLLKQIGPRLHGILRRSDTVARVSGDSGDADVARLGGDEFAVILPNTDVIGAMYVAERIAFELARPFVIADQTLDLGASIGVAVYPDHGRTADMLLRHADVAMYGAKREASGYAVYDSDADPYTTGRITLIRDLREAIERGQLQLYYQPKADLGTGGIVGVEALVRWQHPRDGFIPPPQIIELAEHVGLIKPLTAWLLREATQQCRWWRDRGLDLTVAVNVSVRNLHDQHFADVVVEALEAADLPASALMLEVTESAVMVDPERASEIIHRLDALGVRVSIDDFGTGYSSLSYLKRLPAEELKIDRTFVLNMDEDEENRFIVRAAIALAHDLGLVTVAEGIENQTVWDMLQDLGCDRAQGYHLGRPMPAVEFLDWLVSRDGAAAGAQECLRPVLSLPEIA